MNSVIYKVLEKQKCHNMDSQLALQLMCKTYTNDAYYRPIGDAMRNGQFQSI